MGWNNWARFMCELNETLIRDSADAMVDKGLLDAGYGRVNIDDCWMNVDRHDNGSVMVNETLFPSGMKNLGDYIHEKGRMSPLSPSPHPLCSPLPSPRYQAS